MTTSDTMATKTTLTRRAAFVALAAAPLARPARALVKGYDPGAGDLQSQSYEAQFTDPIQYDVERLMGEIDALKRKAVEQDMAMTFLGLQIMGVAIISALSRRF